MRNIRDFVLRTPIVSSAVINYIYRIERALIAGTYRPTTKHRSIIHYTVNKSASQYVKSILCECARACRLTPVRFSDYAFNSNFPFLDKVDLPDFENYRALFQPYGYVYTPFGGVLRGIEDLENYAVVLMVRDPRDILVSEYYSIAFSHSRPAKNSNKDARFTARRTYARGVDINEYVRNRCTTVASVFDDYRKYLLDPYKHVHITKYEKMISDFRCWLRELVDYCELPVDPLLFEKLVQNQSKKAPTKERPTHQKRSGKSGDYQRKLDKETIAYINDVLAVNLRYFKYSI